MSASVREISVNVSDVIFSPHREIVSSGSSVDKLVFSPSLLAKLDEMQHSPSPLRRGFLIAQEAYDLPKWSRVDHGGWRMESG